MWQRGPVVRCADEQTTLWTGTANSKTNNCQVPVRPGLSSFRFDVLSLTAFGELAPIEITRSSSKPSDDSNLRSDSFGSGIQTFRVFILGL
jgi:hypothetical protein